MFNVHLRRLLDIQILLQLKMFRRWGSCQLISVPSGIEGERKETAESTRLLVKVSSANRLPVLRSVIICRSDIELAEEIPRREMTVSGRSGKQETSKASGPHSNLRRSPATTNSAASGDAFRDQRCHGGRCVRLVGADLKRWRAGDSLVDRMVVVVDTLT